MGVITTRPNATAALGGAVIFGATSAWAALADEVDTTYIRLSAGDVPVLSFAEPTIPGGAKVKSANLRARLKLEAGTGQALNMDWTMEDPAGSRTNIYSSATLIPTWTTMQTTTVLVDSLGTPHVPPTQIEVSIACRNQPSFVQVAALYFDTVYVAQPTVTVSAPTGTITTDTTPTVNWGSTFDTDGGTQTHFEAKFFNSATYGGGSFSPTTTSAQGESGVVASGVSTWTPTNPLTSATYRAYVRVAQTVNGETFWSGWAFSPFTLAVDRPATPGMGVTPDPGQGRIRINLSSNAGAATTTDYEVQYSDDNVNWEGVRTSEPGAIVTASGGAGTTYDYEVPIGRSRNYRARSRHIYAPGAIAVSDWTTTSTATWTSALWWLKHPNPALNMTVEVRSQPTTTRTARRGMFQPLGRAAPIAVQDLRQTPEGEIVFRFDTDLERDDFTAAIATGDSILIQAPPGIFDWPDRWCALGDHTRERAVEQDGEWTFDSLAFTEVERPVP